MKVGSIVFIGEEFTSPVQTGIIVRIEFDKSTERNWFEVLCNDGQNYVIPGWFLSSAQSALKPDRAKMKKFMKTVHHCTNKTLGQLNYIYNQQQHTNT